MYDYFMKLNQSFVGVFDDLGLVGRGCYDERMFLEVFIEQWRKGFQWFEVDREFVIYIVFDVKYYFKFWDFCKLICYVDEYYIFIMLNIEFLKKVVMRSVMVVDWIKGGVYFGEFGKDDVVEFYQWI